MTLLEQAEALSLRAALLCVKGHVTLRGVLSPGTGTRGGVRADVCTPWGMYPAQPLAPGWAAKAPLKLLSLPTVGRPL